MGRAWAELVLLAEVLLLSTRGDGDKLWVKFEPGQIEAADMDELKEIRKTLKKCIRKMERARRLWRRSRGRSSWEDALARTPSR